MAAERGESIPNELGPHSPGPAPAGPDAAGPDDATGSDAIGSGALGSDALGGLGALLGHRLTEAGADRAVLSWELDQGPAGFGDLAAAVETVASLGASAWWGDRGRCVGMTNTTHALGPGRGPYRAVARPEHQGVDRQLWRVTVTAGDGRACAVGEVLLANLRD